LRVNAHGCRLGLNFVQRGNEDAELKYHEAEPGDTALALDPGSALIRELIPLVAALAAAAALYVAREQRRRRTRIHPLRPDLRMREVCEDRDLLETERICLGSRDPRAAFRRATLESAVMVLYLESIRAHGVLDTAALLDASTRHVRTLREYLRLKYDDAATDDWFDHFMAVARPYMRERVRLTREFALHRKEGVQEFARIYDELLRSLVEEALRSPPKKAYVPPDFSHS
jgi:hypothetical protein